MAPGGGREDEAYGSLPAVVADLAVGPDTRYGTCRVAACGPAGFSVVEAAEGWGVIIAPSVALDMRGNHDHAQKQSRGLSEFSAAVARRPTIIQDN